MDLSVAQIVIWVAYFISLYIVIFWLLTYIDRGVWLKKIEIKRFPFVSIVVPVLNEEKNIIWTLDSLVNMNYPRDKIEIIVVNDASTDNSRGEILDYISKQIVDKVKKHILKGNTFQCEVGFKSEYKIKGNSLGLYKKLRKINYVPCFWRN